MKQSQILAIIRLTQIPTFHSASPHCTLTGLSLSVPLFSGHFWEMEYLALFDKCSLLIQSWDALCHPLVLDNVLRSPVLPPLTPPSNHEEGPFSHCITLPFSLLEKMYVCACVISVYMCP